MSVGVGYNGYLAVTDCLSCFLNSCAFDMVLKFSNFKKRDLYNPKTAHCGLQTANCPLPTANC